MPSAGSRILSLRSAEARKAGRLLKAAQRLARARYRVSGERGRQDRLGQHHRRGILLLHGTLEANRMIAARGGRGDKPAPERRRPGMPCKREGHGQLRR